MDRLPLPTATLTADTSAVAAALAATHEQPLLTLDRRARETYQRLGVPFRAIA